MKNFLSLFRNSNYVKIKFINPLVKTCHVEYAKVKINEWFPNLMLEWGNFFLNRYEYPYYHILCQIYQLRSSEIKYPFSRYSICSSNVFWKRSHLYSKLNLGIWTNFDNKNTSIVKTYNSNNCFYRYKFI